MTIEITPYQRKFRRAALQLIETAFRVHTHLDWQTLDNWLETSDAVILLAWENDHLHGVMAASEPLGEALWLRIIACHDDADPLLILPQLWVAMRSRLVSLGIRHIGVFLLHHWIDTYLPDLGFRYAEQIITLRRIGIQNEVADVATPNPKLQIRLGYWTDLGAVTQIDHAAFGPLWRMSITALRHASRQSASFTIAELQGKPVGYQISTFHVEGGHLARLAVVPSIQGQGVGSALVTDMIARFARRGITSISVNTQASNTQSQALYARYGFVRTYQDLPYWQQTLHQT